VEVGGFAVSAADDLTYIEDFVTVKQEVSGAGVEFDDDAVADFFDDQVDAGRKPEQFARVWCHTHPGSGVTPSSVDEETFERVFGECHWAVMMILGRNGETSARLRFNVGPGGQVALPVQVDYTKVFGGSSQAEWTEEYDRNVHKEVWAGGVNGNTTTVLRPSTGMVLLRQAGGQDRTRDLYHRFDSRYPDSLDDLEDEDWDGRTDPYGAEVSTGLNDDVPDDPDRPEESCDPDIKVRPWEW